MLAIECTNLERTYADKRSPGGKRRALRGISLNINSGSIFGLLGPNGAGKTTTVRILSTLITPTAGTARVLGLDVEHDLTEVRSKIGVCFGGERGVFERLTGRQNLTYYALLTRLPLGQIKRRVAESLEMAALTSRADDLVRGYSRGMKQRLHLARALVANPDVIFLDEPTIGLDPSIAHDIRNQVNELRALGKTIFLTTHYMQEADQLCDTIAIISDGGIVAEGTPAEIKQSFDRQLVVEATLPSLTKDEILKGIAPFAFRHTEVASISGFLCLKVFTNDPPSVIAALEGAFGTKISGSCATRAQSLEEAYLSLLPNGKGDA